MPCYPASQAEGDHEWHRDDTPAHFRFRLPTRKSLVSFLLIVIAAWGVLSTTAITVFILSGDPDPDHRAIINVGVGDPDRPSAYQDFVRTRRGG